MSLFIEKLLVPLRAYHLDRPHGKRGVIHRLFDPQLGLDIPVLGAQGRGLVDVIAGSEKAGLQLPERVKEYSPVPGQPQSS